MNEKYLLLERSIQRDLDAIKGIYDRLEGEAPVEDATQDELIVIGYHLHGLYNAFENIFQNVAATFENELDDSARWHAQLLERMRLDVMPVRPALVDDDAYDTLDELRRFRHVFRYGYDIELDSDRLRLVLDKALELKGLYRTRVEGFLKFLRRLQSGST